MPRQTYHYYRYRARESARVMAVGIQSAEEIRAQLDFPFFCEWVTRDTAEPKIQPAHMKVWNELILTEKNSSCLIGVAGQNTSIRAPRGSAKSTFCALLIAWLIGVHAIVRMRLPLLYISYTVDVASPKSAAIKAIIESREYQRIFPMVRKGRKWGDESWSIDYDHAGIRVVGDEDFTVWCAGLKGGIVSKRAAIVLLDDLIKSADDIANPEVRAQMDRNWTRAILPVILPGGRAIHLGNLQRADDIQATRFNEKNGWKVITQSAIVEDDKGNERSYWDFWSLNWLQGLREQDPVGFSFQYQNVIVRSSEISIDPKWIKWGEVPTEASDYEALTIGVDLSSSLKEKADYTVFTLCGRIGNRYYVLDGRRGRWTGNLEKFKHLIELWRDWDCPEIWLRVENVAYQASFSGDFKDYVVNQRGIHAMTCTPVAAKGDKLQRLRGVTGIFENEMIVFNQYRKLKMWETELVNFGSHGHDDTVDSLVYALSGLITASRLETL